MKKENNVVINNKIIPEFISGSSTPVVYQQQASKTLKRVQGLFNFITTYWSIKIKLCYQQKRLLGPNLETV